MQNALIDQTDVLLPRLKAGPAQPIPNLSPEGDFVFPQYGGASLLNLPVTVCQLLGAPPLGAGPLYPEYLGDLGKDIQRVLVLVIDGLGWQRFRGLLERGDTVWSRLAGEGRFSPLTSVVPSTTSAALTTLWTGASPAEHGILGYELWLREFGIVSNMIVQSAITAPNDPEGLRRSGFDPNTFLTVPRLGPHLRGYGVQVSSFMPLPLARSGLSNMHLPEVTLVPYRSPVDLSYTLSDYLESQASARSYTYVYWEELDTLAHVYGPQDTRIDAEFALFSQAFETLFLKRVHPGILKNTLLILTADHGLVYTKANPDFDLNNHPDFARMLHLPPTGENRFAYLYIRPGMDEAVQAYIHRAWPGKFDLVSSAEALQAGLFGPPERASVQTPNRLGDRICVARGDHYLWWSQKENRMLGRHGGLSPAEMLVPLYAMRLG
jgi:predicted AlkP superfamily pyrophosphatase or phosphodiesterase